MSNPYAQQQRNALEHSSPQAAEGWALIEMARRLEEARQQDDRAQILTHTRTNWRIWTIIQSELVDPECTVPKEIRENLLSLSNFIDKRSAEIIATPEAEKLAVLVNINRQVGSGLLGNPGTEDAAASGGNVQGESADAPPPGAESKPTDHEA